VASLTVVESTAGADGSGTTISIPVPEANNFREKASALFRFWPEGSILVDGSAPPALAGEDLGDMFTLVKGETKDYVVMGNVPYPVNIPSGYQTEGLLKVKSYHRKYGLVARIPLGSVHFTPSREALNYTPATVEYLMGVRQRFRETLVEKMVDEDSGGVVAAHHRGETSRSVVGQPHPLQFPSSPHRVVGRG
jgi:hypothetical protein